MKLVSILLVALALVGLAISSYLTIAHAGGTPIACVGVGTCDFVNSSDYATLGSLPVSGLGAGLYVGLVFAALAWYVRPTDPRFPVLYWGLALAGFGYAAYLTYIELVVLDAICIWCMISAGILTTSVIISTAALLRAEE